MLIFPASSVPDALIIVIVLAALAAGQAGPAKSILLLGTGAVLVLVLYRRACETIPLVWLFSEGFSSFLSTGATILTGRSLDVGPTFAGLDFLVTSFAFLAGWLLINKGSLRPRAFYAAGAIVCVHLIYLLLLAFAGDLAELVPDPPVQEFQHPYTPPPWSWVKAVNQVLPWNLPIVTALLHLGVLLGILRWSSWPIPADNAERKTQATSPWAFSRLAVLVGSLLIALLLPVVSTLSHSPSDLTGKKIVANRHGHLDWRRPIHDSYGRLSAGQYGMLPVLVESLGGSLSLSTEFSAEDLQDAALVLWIQPTGPVSAAQYERIWNYVERGGSLLVVAEPFRREGGQESCVNDILKPTAIQVQEDLALSATGNWQQAGQVLAHPATEVLRGGRCRSFTDASTSLVISRPAWPLVVGRWGWSETTSVTLPPSGVLWEGGRRLGDLVLAAEQGFGLGRVAVVGDNAGLTNEGCVHGYEWTGRLLGYLANRPQTPQYWWRQLLGLLLLLCLLLLMVLGWPTALQFVLVAILFSGSLGVCRLFSLQTGRVVPDQHLIQTKAEGRPYQVALIDASHMEAFSDKDWVFDGINGLALNLMRNGFLTTTMPEFTAERLEGAAILISIAPARPFTTAQRRQVQAFVDMGGIFISMVGAEQAEASAALLQDFGIRIPPSGLSTLGLEPEPEPMGHFRTLYLNAKDYGVGDYKLGVIFHTGWPVEAESKDTEVLVRGKNNFPIVVTREVGRGRVVVIGDPGFALNKNLEYIGGEPFEGRYENAHCWRWLITRLTDRPEWIPPSPPPLASTVANPGQEDRK